MVRPFKIVLFIGLSFLFHSAPTEAGVWESNRSWDAKAEEEYSKWVFTSWNPNIFSDPQSRYYGIPTDCADASYAMRAIFAFENGLPFAIRDTSNLSAQRTLSNSMNRWDRGNKTPLEKFKDFLFFVNSFSGTETMHYNTYPVAINRQAIVPGIIFLFSGTEKFHGHTQQISGLSDFGIPRTIGSTQPRAVRELNVGWRFPNFYPGQSTKTGMYTDGYRHFKDPEKLMIPSSTYPGADFQQFEISKKLKGDLNQINETLEGLLAMKTESLEKKALRVFSGLCEDLKARTENVDAALRRQLELKGACMKESDYEIHSTPSRDFRIKTSFENLETIVMRPAWKPLQFRGKSEIEAIFSTAPAATTDSSLVQICHMEGFPGGPSSEPRLTLRDFYLSLKRNEVIWNPNSSLAERWGQSIYLARCSEEKLKKTRIRIN